MWFFIALGIALVALVVFVARRQRAQGGARDLYDSMDEVETKSRTDGGGNRGFTG